MSAPRWAVRLLRAVTPADRAEDVVGDLEETHARRVERRGPFVAGILTAVEAVDMALALLRHRHPPRRTRPTRRGYGFSALDFKLGLRMLVRYPGLTLVGGLALAFAIAVGAGAFQFLNQLVDPAIPLPGGDRIVGIRVVDASTGGTEERSLHDLVEWREAASSLRDLSAFRSVQRNLITAEGRSEPVAMAEMTASGFRVAGVAPLFGRVLVESDERDGAPDVAVIGHDLWQTRFGGDPSSVGRTVLLGGLPTTIVGVMPEGFAFPVAHALWAPLRADPLRYGRGEGPALRIFGRLAPGAGIEDAQAEMTALGARSAREFPDTHEHLRPTVLPYATAMLTPPELAPATLLSINLFFIMLLVLVCGDVALLMFARAATRDDEIVVRTALGASRGRIIAQLFAEALVLGAAAAVAGLAAAGFVLRWWLRVSEADGGADLPFWFSARLSPTTILYALLLALVGAAVAGVLPALKVTGRTVADRLRQNAGARADARFRGIWTAVLIAQVAVTVAFPATAFFVHGEVERVRSLDVGFAAGEFLSARLEVDRDAVAAALGDTSRAAYAAHLHATWREIERRLAIEPAVRSITWADRLPRTHHPARRIEIDGAADLVPVAGRVVASPVAVDVGFFDALDAPLIAGRPFVAADTASAAPVVIVNASFVQRILGGRNAVGQRIRYTAPPDAEPGPWHRIIGVVSDLGIVDDVSRGAGIYHPSRPSAAAPLHVAVRVAGDPASLGPRLRAIAADVDPALRLHDIMPLDAVGSSLWLEFRFLFQLLLLVSGVALLLSSAGIYAVMAFTVSRRTREIGIRVALGADAARIASTLFRRPLTQVGLGVVAGGMLTAALAAAVTGGTITARGTLLVLGYAVVMLGICLLACIVPARRALAVEPTVAMRSDG